MNPDRWRQVDELLGRVLESTPEERSAVLAAGAGEDSDLAREVRSLLVAAQGAGGFMERPAAGGARALLDLSEDDGATLVGARIGPYRIESVIAAGGMGTVCLAQRDDDAYRMKVAIKLVKGGVGGSTSAHRPERIERFHLERRVLAELEHPSIARVLDGGTTDDGRAYLVMEHVDGRPIDAYCDAAGLGVRERLELFARVCDAVQHAHRKLIIHRDLKPANILVTTAGEPKLLDFGLAKLLDRERAGALPTHTTDGQFMGTLAYAAPEQVAGRGALQDTRSDVYALGLILYELIAGRRACTVEGTLGDVVQRVTREVPPPPSRWNPRVGAELDTIVLKALAKEQDRRYQSAGDLADDVRRLLAGEPVMARSDSRLYVLRKTARKYRPLLLGGGGVLALAVGVAVVMTLQAARLAQRTTELRDALRSSNVERARAMASTGSVSEAEQVLWREYLQSMEESSTPDRFAEWALRELYLAQPCTSALRTAEPGVTALESLPDGRRRLATRDRRWAGIIDGAGGAGDVWFSQELAQPSGPAARLLGKGDGVLLGGPDGSLSLWDGATGERVWSHTVMDRPVCRVDTPRGDLIPFGDNDLTGVFDARLGRVIFREHLGGSLMRESAISPDGTRLAVACRDGHVRMYAIPGGEALGVWLAPLRFTSVLDWSPDGAYLAADVDGTMVRVVDDGGREVVTLLGATGWITSVTFHPTRTGPHLVLASSIDKCAYLWEVPSGRLVATLAASEEPLYSAAFVDGGAVVETRGPRIIRQWEPEPLAGRVSIPAPATVFDARFLPDGRVVFAGGPGEAAIRVWDPGSGGMVQRLAGHAADVTSVAISADASRMVSVARDGSVLARSPADLELPGRVLRTGGENLNSVTFSPDGARFAAGGDNAAVYIWDAVTGELLETLSTGRGRVPSVRYSPDGRLIAMAVNPANTILVRDERTRIVHTLAGHAQTARIVRFSPDSRWLATAGDDLTIRIWSVQAGAGFGREALAMTGHQSDIFALAFTPDGAMLASAGRSGVVKLWDVPTGRCLATLPLHSDMVFSLDFSADGRTLLTGGRGGEVTLWDLGHTDAMLAGNGPYFRRRLSP